jgi:hypothetical protein
MADNGDAPHEVTPAAEWGASNVETVELPSGEAAKLKKKLNVWTLFRRGVMTPELIRAYEKAQRGQLEDLGMAIELNDLILAEMFVEPHVFVPDDEHTDVPDGQVHVDQIDDDDVTFVLERAFRGARETGRFRGEPGGAGAGGDGEGVGEDPGGDGGAGDRDAPRVPARPKAGAKARGKRAGGKPRNSAKKSRARS